MRLVASVFALLAFVGSALPGWAQEPPRLAVDRGVGAEACPDADALVARIEQIRGKSAHELAGSYRVSFARKDEGLFAVISTGPAGTLVRTLEHRGPTCAPLANATAVTLALLFDSDVIVKNGPEPVPATAPIAIADTSPPPERPRARHYATLAIGASALAGVLRPVSPGVAAEAGVGGTRWRVNLGALFAIPQQIELGPGTVEERLVSGVARACFAPVRSGPLRIDACSGLWVGLVTAEGRSFTTNERHARPWVAVPLELALAWWTAPIGWEITATGLATVRRQDFAIDGLGVAYRSPPVGGMLSIRAVGIVPF
jgi:hypothetical protein